MERTETTIILYIHGMGGGGDSRIPRLLSEIFKNSFCGGCGLSVVVRTYDFDPEIAHTQIMAWVRELKPALVVGESLGSLQAIKVAGVPHIFVSPSLGAPSWLGFFAWLCLIPGVGGLLNWKFKPRPGDRQPLYFKYDVLRKYPRHGREALGLSPAKGGKDYFYAFFGTKDHYRRTGVVSIRKWRKYFGAASYTLYKGSHFMEEEFVRTILATKILEVLG